MFKDLFTLMDIDSASWFDFPLKENEEGILCWGQSCHFKQKWSHFRRRLVGKHCHFHLWQTQLCHSGATEQHKLFWQPSAGLVYTFLASSTHL